MKNYVEVRCPNCGKRIFDVKEDPRNFGLLRIRCPRCKEFWNVGLSTCSTIEETANSQAPSEEKQRQENAR